MQAVFSNVMQTFFEANVGFKDLKKNKTGSHRSGEQRNMKKELKKPKKTPHFLASTREYNWGERSFERQNGGGESALGHSQKSTVPFSSWLLGTTNIKVHELTMK